MKLQVAGGKSIEVSDAVFGRDFSESLVHQVVTAYLAGARAGTKAQKTRSEVRGGGRKPWRQKGTGRARAGTIRSPLWKGGGRTFAAKPRDFSQKVNKKMYRAAIQSILSELVRQDRLVVVDSIQLDAPSTRGLLDQMGGHEVQSGLIVTKELSDNLYLSARNVKGLDVRDVHGLDPVSLVGSEKVVITTEALEAVQEWLS